MNYRISWTKALLVGCLFLLSVGVDAQESAEVWKSPWEWTLQERLDARYDPEKIRLRHLQAIAEWGEAPQKLRADSGPLVQVYGQWNPELFLPWEVFQWLMRRSFLDATDQRVLARQVWMSRAEHLSLGDRFWERLEEVTESYLALIREGQQGSYSLRRVVDGDSSNDAADEEVQALLLCKERADALGRARQEFGQQVFDRFLYEAVAPDIGISHSVERDAWVLEYIAGGCQ